MSDLLERAKAARSNTKMRSVDYDSDTAIAWLFGEVSHAQVMAVLRGGKKGTPYSWLALSLQKAVKEGKLVKAV